VYTVYYTLAFKKQTVIIRFYEEQLVRMERTCGYLLADGVFGTGLILSISNSTYLYAPLSTRVLSPIFL